jgi:hypothetical protein
MENAVSTYKVAACEQRSSYKKILRYTSKALVIDIGRHLDKVKYKCRKRVEICI